MKLTIVIAAACACLAGGSLPAEACNPLLGENFGKRVSPTALPAAMLAVKRPSTAKPASIVGLWHDFHIANDGTLFLEGYDTWSAGGTESELGKLPPASGDLCVGVWKQAGTTIELTAHVTWLYDLNQNFMGTLNITERNVVSADGTIYTGTFEAHFYDPTGVQFKEVMGTTVAERLGE